ncbi:MAG TPA: hypothetical protein DCR04_13750 [Flavobacteriales bacterium]|nr:hypothetical protein [Flavobacteriales bacterium]
MKRSYLNLFAIAGMAAGVATFSSCNNDPCDDANCEAGQVCVDGDCIDLDNGNEIISANISESTTWTADKVYQLGGRITVLDGVTLTIEPGTIIKGEAGSGANATALLVARGGKLMAEGTASLPIIFTSVADEITPEQVAGGNFVSPNLDPTANGLWGGVIVLGKASISASASEVAIEGIPTTDSNGLYGGSTDDDNSGSLKYISIRHGGSNIGSGNEINGLTLGGVGSGTTIENIEVVSNQDDGIEWFGGAVNVKNVVVWNVGDDGLDTDQAWKGTVDNFVIITPAGHSFELDGPEGSAPGSQTIKNGNVYASDISDPDPEEWKVSGDLINTDDNSEVSLENITIFNAAPTQQVNRTDAALVSFTNVEIQVHSTVTLQDHVNGTVPSGITEGTTSRADESVFGWTWSKQAGAF